VLGVAQVSGNVIVSGALRARGDGATVSGGGSIGIQGCDVTIQPTGVLNNFGDKSANDIRAGGLITIAAGGQVLARPAGTNSIKFLDQTKPPVIAGLIDPLAAPVRDGTLPGCQPPVPPVCGDGEPTGVEGCDDGNLTSCDGCSGGSNGMTCHASGCCQVEGCGNGMQECGEQCDDNNVVDGDGCDSNCTPTACGNGRVTGNEECDDDNTTNGDGCDANCQIEPPPGCGNGMSDPGEECDDNNNVSCDGCSKICLTETCGNNVKECAEACDDGGTDACDGTCAADCSRTVNVCGDGFTDTTCGRAVRPDGPGHPGGLQRLLPDVRHRQRHRLPLHVRLRLRADRPLRRLRVSQRDVQQRHPEDLQRRQRLQRRRGMRPDRQRRTVHGRLRADVQRRRPVHRRHLQPGRRLSARRKTGFPGITCRIEFITTAADAAGVARRTHQDAREDPEARRRGLVPPG
jgi:cysteine-rich repeat protein